MILYIKTIDEKMIYIECECTDNVQRVKELVQIKLNMPIERQRIIFAGKQLEDHRILAGYGIQKESTLYVVDRQLKGCQQK
ncbi:ubiquitin/40S ribosomal protein S27a fusion protein (macronuclear) [Tetrahymena thermophila SB210]|uniref:Ubiquitin/40S ribosomal protein S27a fusion protein n=1 Tax=Tetrahymena thermophila (strain SB210) TaxID=312017 RepID=W7X6N9_TETTS|nr:ubiquitin/40S ribosomal protein S27a fusion protein [Tetrahymena thermophila SB210]EWS72043.1 ubiquitin/40S ribosomal protein S27a fusion protein [Tetrahymena thermophila SB210]|eukprot:XP_012655418.1 ubiquitin/40S ribosomal protein S27a fusion protein [Tetrahymena thermophila SB210]